MRMKKTLALLSALCLMGAFTACGGDSSSTSDSSSTADNSSSAADESSDVTTTAPADTTEAPATTTEAPLPEPDANAITFEDGLLYTAHQMDGGGDEADINLEIVELDGDKKLRVQVLKGDDEDKYGVPKIVFDMPALLGQENLSNIGKITVDFTCVAEGTWKNEDGTEALVVGNFLGALGGNIANEKVKDDDGNLLQNDWATHVEFALNDWENPTHSWQVEAEIPAKKLAVNGYANDEGTSLVIMRWGQENQVDFYIDNITFYDKDGNSMPIIFDGSASADEGAADEADTTDAPAE